MMETKSRNIAESSKPSLQKTPVDHESQMYDIRTPGKLKDFRSSEFWNESVPDMELPDEKDNSKDTYYND